MIAKTPPHGAVEIVPGEFEAPRMPIPAVFPRAAAGEDVPVADMAILPVCGNVLPARRRLSRKGLNAMCRWAAMNLPLPTALEESSMIRRA